MCVVSSSSTTSESGSASLSGVPGSHSSGRTMMPAWSSPSSSSCSERIIPSDTEPRSVACSSTRPVGKHGAGQRDGDGGAGREVPRAAHDLARLSLPHVHRAQLEPVGVGVLARLEHPPDAVETEVAVGVGDAARLDRPHLAAREQQPLRELRRGHVDVDVVAQPGERNPHQNCLSTRRSFSQNMRMSGMPRRCAAMRSSPKPHAKPLHSFGS